MFAVIRHLNISNDLLLLSIKIKIVPCDMHFMLVVDCKDVLSIRNELLVYVSDQVAAIPTLQNNQFTLSTLDEEEDGGEQIDTDVVVVAIREFLESINEGRNFAVIVNDNTVTIASVTGKSIDSHDTSSGKHALPQESMFSCSHCGFVTRYEVELNVHMRIHYF